MTRDLSLRAPGKIFHITRNLRPVRSGDNFKRKKRTGFEIIALTNTRRESMIILPIKFIITSDLTSDIFISDSVSVAREARDNDNDEYSV